MKKILQIALAASFLFVSCKKEPGSVSGNVYYKFNDYVGNKPDAGATIKVFNLDKGAEPAVYEGTADVQGNYKVSGINPADYLLVVKSKTTTALTGDILQQLLKNAEGVKAVFGVDMMTFKSDIDMLSALDFTNDGLIAGMDTSNYTENEVKINENKAKIKKIVDSLLAKFPKDFVKAFDLYGAFGPKIEVKTIKVEETKDVNNNTDFGVTYS